MERACSARRQAASVYGGVWMGRMGEKYDGRGSGRKREGEGKKTRVMGHGKARGRALLTFDPSCMLVSSSSLIEASRAASAAFSAASNASLRAEATFSSLSLLASASIFTCDITRFASSDSGDSDETESGLRSLPFAS